MGITGEGWEKGAKGGGAAVGGEEGWVRGVGMGVQCFFNACKKSSTETFQVLLHTSLLDKSCNLP